LDIDSKSIEIFSIPDDRGFATEWLKDGELTLRRIQDRLRSSYDTLILEPLAIVMDGKINNYKDSAISLMKLNRFAIQYNKRIIPTHHATKPRSDFNFLRAQDRLSGSVALQAFSSTQLVLIQGSERGLDYDSFFVVPHVAQAEEFKICRDERGYFTPYRGR
jgi:hypothetical protein